MQESTKEALRALVRDAMRYAEPARPRVRTVVRYRIPFWVVAVIFLETALLVGMTTVVAHFEPAPDKAFIFRDAGPDQGQADPENSPSAETQFANGRERGRVPWH